MRGGERTTGRSPARISPVYRVIRKIGWLLRLRLETQPGMIWRGAMMTLAWLVRLHGWTLRLAIEDRAGYFDGGLGRPAIILLWHNRIFSAPAVSERYRRNGRQTFVLTSASPEGSLLALFVAHFGIGAVRGSSSRRGSVALREMSARIAEGHDMMITPDGPRGPRYHLQPGALFLAQRCGAPILPVHIEYSRYRRFRTWDGFAIALPFARMRVVIDKPFWVDPAANDEALEEARLRLERIMTDALVMDCADSTG